MESRIILCEAIRKVLEKAFFMVGIVPIEKIWNLIYLTVVSEPPSAPPECAPRDVWSAVDGRLALVERFGAVVVDALVAVDGLVAKTKKKTENDWLFI